MDTFDPIPASGGLPPSDLRPKKVPTHCISRATSEISKEAEEHWQNMEKFEAANITPLELAHLTARLIASQIIRLPKRSGKHNQSMWIKLARQALDFKEACYCAVLEFDTQAKSNVLTRFEQNVPPWGKFVAHAEKGRVSFEKLLRFNQCHRLKLNADDLKSMGGQNKWEDLNNREKLSFIFRFLCTEKSGVQVIPGDTHLGTSFRENLAPPLDVEDMIKDGVRLEDTARVSALMLESKEAHKRQVNRQNAHNSRKRRKPRYKDDGGRFVSKKEGIKNSKGQFKKRK